MSAFNSNKKKANYLAKFLFSGFLCGSLFIQPANKLFAQSGDQVLDGIGETDLMARYVFSGDFKDWSRNHLTGTPQGSNANFVSDSLFGTVLSLAEQSYLTIPAEVLTNIESISVSGWVKLRSNDKGQYLFDFGQSSTQHFFVAPAGTSEQANCVTYISGKNGKKQAILSAPLALNKWVHVVAVVNIASKVMTTYIDGKPAGKLNNISLDWAAPAENKLFIGKSLSKEGIGLHALLHDFRIYRVGLDSVQVAGIYNNALHRKNESVVNTRKESTRPLPRSAVQLYNNFLTSVEDVAVETSVGNLPRLPRYVKGTYKSGVNGPDVRVLWPIPTDNSSVLNVGEFTVTGTVPGTDLKPKAIVTVKANSSAKTPEMHLEPFKLSQVSLNANMSGSETQFIENRDKFISTLAHTDPNSFLYMFRDAFGQKQPEGTRPLGVWDSRETKLRGHATGHYLSAIAQAYASTAYDPALHKNFAEKMTYMVDALYDLSQLSGKPKIAGGAHISDPNAVPVGAGKTDYDSDLTEEGIRTDYWNWGKGFISAYPPDQFIMLEKGAKYGGQKTQIWAPYYTLHKILAGLMDVYEISGNKKALDIATGMGDWVYERLSRVPAETRIKMWNTYIAGEFGGMNEAMARMYRLTGKKTYLETAKLFDNIKVFFGDTLHSNGLAKNVDNFRGLHANQHIPQVVGSVEEYRASNNPEYYKIADNFWHKITNDYMYSIGGVAGARNPANAECFTSEPGTLYENGFSEGGQNETCATYNMLKLTRDLFVYDQEAEFMDYYERALYNDILASVAENSPANTYHIPLLPGSVKQFSNASMKGFTCCNGTALESSTSLQNAIYFKSKDNKALYVNLFIPSTLSWTERNLEIKQETNFPNEDKTFLTIMGSGKFDLYIRVPGWATKGFFVKINGKEQAVKATPGEYLKLSRNWKNGDVIALQMPFQFNLQPVMDQQNIASLFYGPILLAAQEPEPRKEWRKITLDANDISKSIEGDPKTLEFKIGDAIFKPFYKTYGRHSVYVDVTLTH